MKVLCGKCNLCTDSLHNCEFPPGLWLHIHSRNSCVALRQYYPTGVRYCATLSSSAKLTDWSCERFLATSVQNQAVNSKQLSAECEVNQDDFALQLLGNTHPIHSTDAAVEVTITAGKVIRNMWRGSTNSRAVFAVNELCAQRTWGDITKTF